MSGPITAPPSSSGHARPDALAAPFATKAAAAVRVFVPAIEVASLPKVSTKGGMNGGPDVRKPRRPILLGQFSLGFNSPLEAPCVITSVSRAIARVGGGRPAVGPAQPCRVVRRLETVAPILAPVAIRRPGVARLPGSAAATATPTGLTKEPEGESGGVLAGLPRRRGRQARGD